MLNTESGLELVITLEPSALDRLKRFPDAYRRLRGLSREGTVKLELVNQLLGMTVPDKTLSTSDNGGVDVVVREKNSARCSTCGQ